MMDWGGIPWRVTLLWAAGEVAALLVSRRNVRLGHLVRVAVIAGMLAVPLLSLWLPAQSVAVPGWRTGAAAVAAEEIPFEPVTATAAAPAAARPGVDWPAVI